MQKTIAICLVESEHLPVMGAFTIKGTQSSCQMQCDIVPCLLWKTSLCIVFIQITIFFAIIFIC